MNQAEDPPGDAGEPPLRARDDVCLRAALSSDAPGLAAVFVSCWLHAYHGVVPEEKLQALEESEIALWLETLIGAGTTSTTVAQSASHELLGFCRHGRDPDDQSRGHVFSLYVTPAAAGRGLGTRLLTHALDDLSQRDLAPVTIWVFEQNAPARRLYDACGFAPDGAKRVEPEYGADEIRLSRPKRSVL